MDGENNGKPYEQMDDLGVPLFLETPIYAPPQPQHVAGKGMYNLLSTLAKVILWNQTFGINSGETGNFWRNFVPWLASS